MHEEAASGIIFVVRLGEVVGARLRKWCVRASQNLIAAGVIAILIAAAIPGVVDGVVDTVEELFSASSAGPSIERVTWGPSRILYRCAPNLKCLAPSHVVFDSITNSLLYGNEASFMQGKLLGTRDAMKTTVDVKVGDRVFVTALVDNNASLALARSRPLVALNTRFRLSIPANSAKELPLTGYISADNAQPRSVYSTVSLRASTPFAVEYAWGSATLSGELDEEVPLGDNIIAEGTPIGSRGPNGYFFPGESSSQAISFSVIIVSPHQRGESARTHLSSTRFVS